MVKKVLYLERYRTHDCPTNNLMYADGWRPDYIVGMTRGGLVPVMMSNSTGILMHALDVRFPDTETVTLVPESNTWMAEDAFGYPLR